MYVARRDKCMYSGPLCHLQGLRRTLYIERTGPGQGCHLNPGKLAADCVDGLKVSFRGDRKPGFEDVHTQVDKLSSHLQLLRHRHAATGRLFTIAQSSIEDIDSAQNCTPVSDFPHPKANQLIMQIY